jgi:hypothetical protein
MEKSTYYPRNGAIAGADRESGRPSPEETNTPPSLLLLLLLLLLDSSLKYVIN